MPRSGRCFPRHGGVVERAGPQLVALDVSDGLRVVRVSQRRDQPRDPVGAVAVAVAVDVDADVDLFTSGRESGGGLRDPPQRAVRLRPVRTDLPDRERVVAVDPGGADGAALGLGAAGRVRVEHGALVVGAEHVLDVLEGEQALGATASRQVTGFRACPDVPAAAVSRLLALRRSHPEARRARALTPAVNWSKPNRT